MGSAWRRFGQALEDEILRRMRAVAPEYDMQRSGVEDIGEAARIPRKRVEGVFLDLAGKVWAGWIYPEDVSPIWISSPRSVPPWTNVVFEPSWFQEQGKLEIPLG
jgi:hypothetical protein